MGVLNVTPDSFSDGGAYATVDGALDHARVMIEQGAVIVDVGPESTRPGSQPVPSDEQIARAVPVIRAIRAACGDIVLSIDTRSAAVARAALEAGADMVNDVSALRDDEEMVDVVAESSAAVVLMHRRGTAADMQRGGGPRYGDVVEEITRFLRERVDWTVARGVERSRIVIDPGIGFGKRVEHNLQILRDVERLAAIGPPVLIGASRKAFIGNVSGVTDPKRRDAASAASAAIAVLGGAAIVRAHDVSSTVDAVRVAAAVRAAGAGVMRCEPTRR